jgi:hypothetical protein
MRGLVVLVMEKMAADLPTIMEDEHLFCHLVDEAIFFDHELHQIYDYPSGLNSSMDTLTVPKVFNRWIEIEKKCKGSFVFVLFFFFVLEMFCPLIDFFRTPRDSRIKFEQEGSRGLLKFVKLNFQLPSLKL